MQQKATTPKRFYIDHNTNDHKVEVRSVVCPWPRTQVASHPPVIRQPETQAERLFSAGRLIRGGFLRKR